ncbi:MAG: hypothetical protein HY595_04025 [Candidatus Omnitrophica bacterium]|nr:hypothetical protein [Candidatus Omnitrophota bacterium]
MRRRGYALVELVAAAVIGALIAGGMLMALVTALRIAQQAGGIGMSFFSSMMGQYHNFVACDSTWFTPATCATNLPPGASAVAFPSSMQKVPEEIRAKGSYRVNRLLVGQPTIHLKAVVEVPSG